MLNKITRAEMVAMLVPKETAQTQTPGLPDADECTATDSECCMQKMAEQLRSPSLIIDDCQRQSAKASDDEVRQRARHGVATTVVKVKSHTGIYGSEMGELACK